MTLTRAVALLVLPALLVRPVDAQAEALDRIRPTAPYLTALIREGVAGSTTFRALVERITRSDLVVYVVPSDLGTQLLGQLTFMTAVGKTRYLRIQVGWHLPTARAIASLGHELQHAVEVAEAPAIRDEASFAREFARIGYPSPALSPHFGINSYDTTAAVETGHRVWLELARQAD
jgi:hypothetical protein